MAYRLLYRDVEVTCDRVAEVDRLIDRLGTRQQFEAASLKDAPEEPLPPIEKWPTLEESAQLLGASVRSIWRYAQQGRIEMRKRPSPGRKLLNVCNPQELAELRLDLDKPYTSRVV
jgi:hypothetical protein